MPLTQIQQERLERGGLYSLLKLMWMGTQRVQMKGVLLWLVRWAYRAGTKYFCPALAALIGPVQNISFPYTTLPYFILFVPMLSTVHWTVFLLTCQFNQLKDGDGAWSGFWKLMKLAWSDFWEVMKQYSYYLGSEPIKRTVEWDGLMGFWLNQTFLGRIEREAIFFYIVPLFNKRCSIFIPFRRLAYSPYTKRTIFYKITEK